MEISTEKAIKIYMKFDKVKVEISTEKAIKIYMKFNGLGKTK